jgi:hypothetical protein
MVYRIDLAEGFTTEDFWRLGNERLLNLTRFSHTIRYIGPRWLRLYYWVRVQATATDVGSINEKVTNEAQLRALIDKLLTEQKTSDKTLPYWRYVFVPNYGPTVLFVLNHALGDGESGLAAMCNISDNFVAP